MRKLHITNSAQRNATVACDTVPREALPTLALPDGKVYFRRYVAAAPGKLDGDMVKEFGDEYGQAIVDGDPEIDFEQVGRFVGDTDTVFLSSEGEILHCSPSLVEVLIGPDGEEKERREPKDELANVVDENSPVRWTGKKIPKADAARRFSFKRTVQLQHVDGLTYDYLYGMAKELAEENVVVLLGAGEKGNKPLIFQSNGTPYRGFLEGRVDGEKYMLLLHLSNLELKVPKEKA